MKPACETIDEFWSIFYYNLRHLKGTKRTNFEVLRGVWTFFPTFYDKFSMVLIKFWDVFDALYGEKF